MFIRVHPAIRDAETAKHEFGLAIGLPSGDRVVLLEMKVEAQSTNLDDSDTPDTEPQL